MELPDGDDDDVDDVDDDADDDDEFEENRIWAERLFSSFESLGR